MTTVIDASAVVDLLTASARAGEVLSYLTRHRGDLVTVPLLDAEVLSALARLHRADELTAADVTDRLHRLGELPIRRLPTSTELLTSAWDRRTNVAVRDALYVAAAEALGARLLTTDDRLARAVPELAVQL